MPTKKKSEKAKPKVSKIRTEETVLTVTRTYSGLSKEEKRKVIQVKPFITDPARLRVNKGMTLKIGEFEFVRFDVSVELPCYKEEIMDALPVLNKFVEGEVSKEAKEVMQDTGREEAGETDQNVEAVL